MSKRLLIVVLLILTFGLIILSSAGLYDGNRNFGSPYHYLKDQIFPGVILGLLGFYFASKIEYPFWRKTSILALLFGIAAMALVFVPEFGREFNGARRWVTIGGQTFQPSEILKLALIMYLAAWFSGRVNKGRGKDKSSALLPFITVVGIAGGMLAMQPDFGTLGITVLIALAMYFAAGFPIKNMLIISAIIGVVGFVFVYTEDYRWNRVMTLFNPTQDLRGKGYQVNQAVIAIGSGGVWGKGYSESTQKVFIPEVVNDSIFAIVAEELGFVGSVALIGLYVFLCYTLIGIARAAPDHFGQLFVIGVATWVTGQAFLNIMANIRLAPLTGVPLPFVSHGGTALMILLFAMGIAHNVAQQARSK